MDLIGDYHTHTQYSDGEGSMEDMIKGAISKGLQELAITDHGPANRLFHGKEGDFLLFKEELSSLQIQYPQIRLFLGAEANIISDEGDLDLSQGLLEELDLILAGLHLTIQSPKGWGSFFRGKNLLHSYLSSYLFSYVREINTRAVIGAIERYPIHTLTHPGLHMNIDTFRVAEVAARRGTFMELSSRHRRVGVEYIKTVAKAGASLIVNSDAHSPEEVGEVSSLYPLILASGLGSSFFVNLDF